MTPFSHTRRASRSKRFLFAWQKHPDFTSFVDQRTGKSIYVDRDTSPPPPDPNNPDPENYHKVDVVLTIGGVVPSNGGVVTLDMLDPPNVCVPDGYIGDNNSESFYFVTSQTLTFMPGQFAKTTEVSVGTHAGNNYIIEATAQNGNPGQGIPNQVEESEILTVWRRLWYEIDVMELPNNVLAPLTPVVDGNTTGQFQRACIDLLPFPDQVNPTVTGTEVIPSSSWDGLPNEPPEIISIREDITQLEQEINTLLQMIGFFMGKSEYEDILQEKLNEYNEKNDLLKSKEDELKALLKQYYNQLFASPREIPASSPDYWALHLVGAFQNVDAEILGLCVGSTCYVFGENIATGVSSHNSEVSSLANNPPAGVTIPDGFIDYYSITDPELVVPWITLHEIGHCFGLVHLEGITQGDMSPFVMQVGCNFYRLAFDPNGIFSDEEIMLIQQNGFYS